MNIGIDLRPLQTGHKFRGIGEVAKQTTNRILQLALKEKSGKAHFIFYEYEDDDPKELLDIPKGLSYEVIKLGKMPENNLSVSKYEKFSRAYNSLYGVPVSKTSKCDVFLQFDYALGVPRNTRTVLIKHDIIPYIFWDKYFESAWIPFKNKAMRSTLRTIFANRKFMRVLRRSLKNANVILTVSKSTMEDLNKYFKVPNKKMKVSHLGVSINKSKTNENSTVKDMPIKPYLLFVGAGDARRRVDDAVAAYNNLKAEGHDIQLVLVGENFKSPEAIPNPAVRSAVMSSSYKKDILTLGYVDDGTKQKLYKNALAFVYPTRYEGFGIPVLESMLLECPIITYKNSSIPEVGGDYALYTDNWEGIKANVEKLLDQSASSRKKQIVAAKKYAENFTWDKTAKIIYDELVAGRVR
jgi:glycosyltransferase involved in cell wall biosynthesis